MNPSSAPKGETLEYYYLKRMNINRHNYEAFFLLYVDKELSTADRKAVDVFVKENPDLQMELWALQQTVVKADDIVLDKKDWLYMEAALRGCPSAWTRCFRKFGMMVLTAKCLRTRYTNFGLN